MCSRYEMSSTPREIMARFGFEVPPPAVNQAEIRPTDQAMIADADGPRLGRWGLAVAWDSRPLINARSETLDGRPTFRPLLANRCIVPADAYFEWRATEGGKRKNRIAPKAGGPFAFAGLSDGAAFTIVTCPPAPAIAHIHDRMPVILAAAGESRWLDRSLDFSAVRDLLAPYGEPLEAEEERPVQGSLFG